MSSIQNPEIAGEGLLDLHIEAARQQFDAAGVEQAARRLRAKLSQARGNDSLLSRFPALVGAVSVVLVTILAVSLLVPGANGTAFAQAQEWLASFHTLEAETTVVAGDSVSTVVAWLDESGDTRIESLGTTTIIKPEEGMIYVLSPDGRSFAQRITSERIVGSSMEFLDDIRAFRGRADMLAGRRMIDGVSAAGYELEVDSTTSVLWVDPTDGRPLLVEARMPDGTTMRTVLRFDLPLPENAFEIPEDSQLLFR
jgi:outer membrane lipoprotein-sorting protein